MLLQEVLNVDNIYGHKIVSVAIPGVQISIFMCYDLINLLIKSYTTKCENKFSTTENLLFLI